MRDEPLFVSSPYSKPHDFSNPYRSDWTVINWVGPNKRVLDIGCANGQIARWLKNAGCRVTGIELDENLAAEAEAFCDQVVRGNVELPGLLESVGHAHDTVVMTEVLEHLIEPRPALRCIKKLLGPDGRLIISVPNVAFWRVRMALLFGHFDYQESGQLDVNHLHFFTTKTVREMLEEEGYRVLRMRVAPAGIEGNRVRKLPLGKHLVRTIWFLQYLAACMLPDLFGYQIVLLATR